MLKDLDILDECMPQEEQQSLFENYRNHLTAHCNNDTYGSITMSEVVALCCLTFKQIHSVSDIKKKSDNANLYKDAVTNFKAENSNITKEEIDFFAVELQKFFSIIPQDIINELVINGIPRSIIHQINNIRNETILS